MAGERTSKPAVGLGIDVGGTFSDSVLIDLDERRLLSKAKSPTTHEDLAAGVRGSVGLLDRQLFPQIQLVSLSTTLATNALVEGRRSRVVAILPGYAAAQCPAEFMESICLVAGGHTAEGEEIAPLDLQGVRRAVEDTCGSADAYAVSSYFSTRNPSHEEAVRDMIGRLAPGVPVVCGHGLSLKLNAKTRATTAILNAHLIPLIRALLRSVKEVLKDYAIRAPLMVVKGDGSLFREEVVAERPVETILSGPAASVVGASFLMGRSVEQAVVIDIGGTTSDIAVLKNGSPRLNEQGVTVGSWQTHVTAVDVRPVGLGGDSHIWTDQPAKILIGPKRVEPLCLLADRYPEVVPQLRDLLNRPRNETRFTPTAFWIRNGAPECLQLTGREAQILEVLEQGPRNIFGVASALETYPIAIRDDLARLEAKRALRPAGFTPTDMFQIRDLYRRGDREASVLAADVLAHQLGMETESFLLEVKEIFNRKASLEIVEALASHPVPYRLRQEECPACRDVWTSAFWERHESIRRAQVGRLRWSVALEDPLVGIGAPANILVPPLAERLHTEALIPEHAEVANALGAIVGTILVQQEVLIRPATGNTFVCFTADGKLPCDTLNHAVERGRTYLAEKLQSEVRRAGGDEMELTIREERKQARLASGLEMIVEVILRGKAIAKPRFHKTVEVRGRPT
ncbi:MAG: hydantoinase/oxoprolinase family protein [Deltaproteobacteria bacterium]|nr:hydantoinase/oxoprolinase family protein [Deltaproteobacteria bacterium]